MKLITKQDRTKKIADRWKLNFYLNGKWSKFTGSNQFPEDKYNKLVALGNNPTVKQINEIIGNDSWTIIICSNCKESVDKLIDFEAYDDIVSICKKCLTEALNLINT